MKRYAEIANPNFIMINISVTGNITPLFDTIYNFGTSMSQNVYVTERLCHRTSMSQNVYVTERLCHRTAVSQNGYVTERLCHRTSMSQNAWSNTCLTFRGKHSIKGARLFLKILTFSDKSTREMFSKYFAKLLTTNWYIFLSYSRRFALYVSKQCATGHRSLSNMAY